MAKNVPMIDYYKEFNIDRTLDEKSIKQQLVKLQQIHLRRQSATNDKEELSILEEIINKIGDAIHFLTKKNLRQQYDADLEKAYAEGKVSTEDVSKAKDLLEQAEQMFRRGRFKQAVEYAVEAIENNPTGEEAYDMAIRSYAAMEQYDSAFKLLNKAVGSVVNKDYFIWLSARLNIVGLHNYEAAQEKINELLERNPDNETAHSEQIFLYMHAGKEDLAFNEIDQYIAKHPDADAFRKESAYNIINFSKSSYVTDPKDGVAIIADKQGYSRILKLRNKACEIYRDEYTKKMLDDAKFYGQRKFNKDNLKNLIWMWIVGICFGFEFIIYGGRAATDIGNMDNMMAGIIVILLGVFLLAMPTLLTVVSFRPYWQLNRIYLTGNAGAFETTVITIGNIYTFLVKKALWLLWTCIKLFVLFIRELVRV
ncbi:MAG: hypothetical protein J6C64_00295 [Lachnospiraceae bacterium]|nr:hypothetical protein [Lachnospiraceae bacterium]